MKVYIAAPWVNKPEAAYLAGQLEENGFDIARRWWETPETNVEEELVKQAELDLLGVKSANALVYCGIGKSEGKATELGYALGLGKLCVALVPKLSTNIFTRHPAVITVRAIDDVVYTLIEAEATIGEPPNVDTDPD